MKRASSLRFRRPKPIGRSVGAGQVLDDGHAQTSCLLRLRARPPSGRRRRCSCSRCSGRCCRRSRCGSPGRSGRGSRRAARALVISIPGVQKPHCSACFSWKPCWIGSSSPSTSSDSTVRISWPSHIAASVVHDLTGLPSISTTQAPQLDVSQPQWVPVRLERLAEEVDEQQARLDVARDLLAVDGHRDFHVQASWSQRAGRRAAQCALGQHAREVALVVDRPAAVGHRRAVLRGDLARLREQLLRRRPARAAAPRRGCRSMVVRPTALSAMPASAIVAAVHPHGRRRGGDGPVAGAALDLLVGAAGARPHGQADLGQHLAVADGGHVRADVEVLHADHPLAVGAADDDLRLGRRADGREVLGRIGLAQRAADRAAVAHHRVGDHVLGVAEEREALGEQVGLQQVDVPRQRADPDLAVLLADVGQLGAGR